MQYILKTSVYLPENSTEVHLSIVPRIFHLYVLDTNCIFCHKYCRLQNVFWTFLKMIFFILKNLKSFIYASQSPQDKFVIKNKNESVKIHTKYVFLTCDEHKAWHCLTPLSIIAVSLHESDHQSSITKLRGQVYTKNRNVSKPQHCVCVIFYITLRIRPETLVRSEVCNICTNNTTDYLYSYFFSVSFDCSAWFDLRVQTPRRSFAISTTSSFACLT